MAGMKCFFRTFRLQDEREIFTLRDRYGDHEIFLVLEKREGYAVRYHDACREFPMSERIQTLSMFFGDVTKSAEDDPQDDRYSQSYLEEDDISIIRRIKTRETDDTCHDKKY